MFNVHVHIDELTDERVRVGPHLMPHNLRRLASLFMSASTDLNPFSPIIARCCNENASRDAAEHLDAR
jgi:hypothetical protein